MVGLDMKPPICADISVTWYELTFTVARKVILISLLILSNLLCDHISRLPKSV